MNETVQLTPEQERARKRRNLMLALAIAAFMLLVFLITVARLGGAVMEPRCERVARPDSKRMAFTAGVVVAAVLGMTGLAFAAVPLYDLFCKVTGYGGTTQQAQSASARVLDRTLQIRFDSNVASDVPFEFVAAQTETIRIGETGLAFYRVRNISDQPVTAIASYNVAPHIAGQYFQKLECFCFQEQTLAPGAELELPVVFFVDPEIASDPDTAELSTVTLSYTFFRSADEASAALTQ